VLRLGFVVEIMDCGLRQCTLAYPKGLAQEVVGDDRVDGGGGGGVGGQRCGGHDALHVRRRLLEAAYAAMVQGKNQF